MTWWSARMRSDVNEPSARAGDGEGGRARPSVGRSATQFGLGTAIGTVVAGVTTVLVARSMPPGEWGHVALSASWALGVATLVLFGLPQLATRELAAGRITPESVWRATITSALLCVPVTFALLITLGVPAVLSLLAAVLSLILALRSGGSAPLVAADRFRWLGVASVVERVITLVVALVLMVLWNPLFALIAAQCVGFGVIAFRQAAGVVQLRKLRPLPVSTLVKGCRSRGAFGVNALLFSVAQLDIVLVYALAGETESGYFGIASRLVLPLAAVGMVVSTVLLPRIARVGSARVPPRLLGVLLLTMSAAFVIGTTLLNTALVPLLGTQYQPAVRVCVVYFASVMVVVLTQPLVAVAQGCGLERTAAWLLAGSEIVHLVGALVGAAWAGAFGAAFGYLAGNVLLLVSLLAVLVVREKRITWS